MNDKEKLFNLLKELGIGYDEVNNSIVLDERCKNVDAYMGCFTEFLFDDNGKFIKVMIGE